MGYYINITGQKRGRLTILSFHKSSNKGSIWTAVCDCGNLKNIRSDNFKKGKNLSCGCFVTDYNALNNIKSSDYLARRKYNKYRSGSKVRNLSFNLSYKEFFDLVISPCHYCKINPAPLNGIDRINNSIGYTIKNSTPCCSLCNMAKGSMSYERFVSYINRFASITPNS